MLIVAATQRICSTPCFFDRPIMVTASRPPLAIKFVAISAGPRSTCAIDIAGAVRCWGSALRGAPLGRNETADMPSTVPINGTVVSVSVGESSACAATATGEAYCWGSDDKGQLGDGGPIPGTNSISPVRVAGPQDYVAVSAKQTQACGLTAAGVLRCWGGVDAIDIGVTGTRVIGTASPVSVDGVQASSVAVGGLHVCAVDSAPVTSCWGGNASGQVGHGRNQTVPLISVVPTPVARYDVQRGPTVTIGRPSLPPESLSSTRPFIKPTLQAEVATIAFSNLAVGGQHACAIAASGLAYCWGADGFGQIGNGNRTTAACRFGPGSPTPVCPRQRSCRVRRRITSRKSPPEPPTTVRVTAISSFVVGEPPSSGAWLPRRMRVAAVLSPGAGTGDAASRDAPPNDCRVRQRWERVCDRFGGRCSAGAVCPGYMGRSDTPDCDRSLHAISNGPRLCSRRHWRRLLLCRNAEWGAAMSGQQRLWSTGGWNQHGFDDTGACQRGSIHLDCARSNLCVRPGSGRRGVLGVESFGATGRWDDG